MESHGKFGSNVGCIDGRTLEPILAWAREHTGVQWVDFVTRPGMDGFLLTEMNPAILADLKWQLSVSVEKHSSKYVFVSGHCECAGNPVSETEHRTYIAQSCEIVRSWGLPEGVEVIGLLVNPMWGVDRVTP